MKKETIIIYLPTLPVVVVYLNSQYYVNDIFYECTLYNALLSTEPEYLVPNKWDLTS